MQTNSEPEELRSSIDYNESLLGEIKKLPEKKRNPQLETAIEKRIESDRKVHTELTENPDNKIGDEVKNSVEYQELQDLFNKKNDLSNAIAANTLQKNQLNERDVKKIQKSQLKQAKSVINKAESPEQLSDLIVELEGSRVNLMTDAQRQEFSCIC